MLITNLEHFLTPNGSIAPKEGPALRLADYLTKIVVAETAFCQTQSETMVIRCRRRPNRKPCAGQIDTYIDPVTNQINWCCSVCEEQGSISHWQGSLWDCTDNAQSH
jgi:hypothetical protein